MDSVAGQKTVRWAVAAAMLAAIVGAYRFVAPANPTTVALTLLLLVLVLARWGLRYAVATSIAATVCYNFFFLPPIGTFTIADPQNWLTLFAFLATGVVGSRLAEQARREAEQARTRQRELEVLYRLSRDLLQAEDVSAPLEMIAQVVQQVVRQVAHASAVGLLMLDGRTVVAGEGFSAEEQRDAAALLARGAMEIEQIGDAVQAVPMHAGVRPRGLLLLRGVALSVETLEAMGGVVSVSLDRAQALAEVTRTRAAQESERMRKVMMDAVTHELRTPLTAIKAAATTLLGDDSVAAADRRELLEVIDEEADRLNRLVARAVEVTQLEAHEAQMTFAPVEPAALAEASLEESAVALGRHVVQVRVGVGLPQVLGDAAYLAKVLQNLLENAAKYSRAGTVICLEGEAEAGAVVLRVVDRGVGVDASETGLIFDPLYRAKTQSDVVPGTGMGLAISRSIAEAHGGSLVVKSEPGMGSTFELRVPRVAANGLSVERL